MSKISDDEPAVVEVSISYAGGLHRCTRRISAEEVRSAVVDPIERDLYRVVDEVLEAYRERKATR